MKIEIDESYFLIWILGAKRVRGKRGLSSWQKKHLFFASFHLQLQAEGMLKRNEQVYTQVVKGCSASELLPILRDCSDLG